MSAGAGSKPMPKRRSESDRSAGDRPIPTPSRELERLRGGSEATPRRALEAAALEAAGEAGYRGLTVQRILDRAGVGRNRFYETFANKEECYASAYAVAIEALIDDLLATCAAEADWRAGLRSTLARLAALTVERPELANGILAQVHVAGGAPLAKRNEVFERLSRAVDGARRETAQSRHSPPPVAAAFIVSAVEQAVVGALARGVPEEFAAAVPDLVFLAVSIYYGADQTR